MRALILAIGIAAAVVGCSRTVSQKDYASPEEATQALVTAAKAKDAHGLLEVLGADAQPVIDSGDPVRDQHARERFLQAYEAGHSFDNGTEGQTTLQVGSDKWPFPFPLKQHGARWSFDSSAGAEEIINRRVGENELDAAELGSAETTIRYAVDSRLAFNPAPGRHYVTALAAAPRKPVLFE